MASGHHIYSAELIVDCRNNVGESPIWCADEASLYWVDIPAAKLWRWSQASNITESWSLPGMAGCIAFSTKSGALIGAVDDAFMLLVPSNAGLWDAQPIATVVHLQPNMRFNDGRTDRQGRMWAGSMQKNMPHASGAGTLYRLDGSGQNNASATAFVTGLYTPNGLAFSPDGRIMYLSDSHPSVRMVWAFDYDVDTGTPSNRRVFVDMRDAAGRPDGAAVDVDGCYWVCGNDAGVIYRYTPNGLLDKTIHVPIKKPAMCAFGGNNMDTLFVTSIRPADVDLSDQPLAGGVFALSPGAQGIAETKCSASPSSSTPAHRVAAIHST